MNRSFIFHACTIAGTVVIPGLCHAGYRIERVASGLNQPTYLTQAPGDPANIVYFSERTSNTIGGFGAVNQMGKIWRYDLTTRTKTLVVDLSSRLITNDDGLETFAFHPDFNNPGTLGYHKLYVSSAQYPNPGNAIDRVEEYTVGAGGTASLTRTILQYTNNTQNNHTVDWVGFDPNATGAARNYLYITTGDSSFGNAYNGGLSPNGRPSQNPSDVRGKMLRLDITPGAVDAYPADPNKNFAIPSSNPIPTWNSAHSGTLSINGVGEVYVTGLRNAYRISFDRATSDMYMGDVGENSVEEVDFLKAGSNTGATPPVDYGWPQKEGTNFSGVSGAPNTTTNPFTQATSLYPIQQFPHMAGGDAVIGGYVYRGPVTELQGKYFYSDFVQAGKVWQLDFDRDTNPATFNGNNGTLPDVSARWNSRVFDPNDPTYISSTSINDLAGIDHIVSYGEDNAGNLYLIDFGNRSAGQSSFDGQYPAAGLGEIFRVVSGTINGTWNVDGNANWFSAGNWTAGGVPGMAGDQANFGNAITSARMVSVDVPQAVATLTFDSLQSYTLGGPATLTLQAESGPAMISVNSGSHTIAAPVAVPGDLTIQANTNAQISFTPTGTDASGQTVTKTGPGTAQFVSIRAATLSADQGLVRISLKVTANNTSGTSVVQNLVIGSGLQDGRLDLTNNSFVIDYSGPVGTLLDDTRSNLHSGKLFTSSATASKTLGYADNATLGMATFSGQSVDASSILIKYTYAGDANLDGQVDVTDLGALATNWQSSDFWSGGDFNYDGFVDVTDLGILATNWQLGVGHPLGPGALQQALAAVGLAGVNVPEPAVPVLVLMPFAFAAYRRRRHRWMEIDSLQS